MNKESLIKEMLDIEWVMFHTVNGEDGPKASCQNDRDTFIGMRSGQFSAWDEATCEAYLSDLKNAKACGRNLAAEKYIHMMKNTTPSQYEKLKHLCTFPDEEGLGLVQKITDKMIEQTVKMFDKYPYISGCGRPVHSEEDWGGYTSIETYQKGELMTYSTETLRSLYAHLTKLESAGESLALNILENSVKYYGYKTLEDAEAATKKVADNSIEFSFGCGRCGCGND